MTVIDMPLFAVPVFKFKATNHETIKKYMIDHVYPHFVKNGVNDKAAQAYTDYVPGAVKVPWNMLEKFYYDDVQNFLEHTGIDFSLGWKFKIRCWYALMTNTSSQFVHDHTGGPKTIQWSMVHYVKVDNPDSAGTVFMNPNIRMIKSVTPTKNRNLLPEMYLPPPVSPVVSEGDVVVFPSWLDHHTPAHTDGSLRIVVPLNVMLSIDDGNGEGM